MALNHISGGTLENISRDVNARIHKCKCHANWLHDEFSVATTTVMDYELQVIPVYPERRGRSRIQIYSGLLQCLRVQFRVKE